VFDNVELISQTVVRFEQFVNRQFGLYSPVHEAGRPAGRLTVWGTPSPRPGFGIRSQDLSRQMAYPSASMRKQIAIIGIDISRGGSPT